MLISSFINNQPYAGSGLFKKINPFTGESLYDVSNCDIMGVVQAVQAANRAFADWKDSNSEQRLALTLRIKSWLKNNVSEIVSLESLDQALPRKFMQTYGFDSLLEQFENNEKSYKTQLLQPAVQISPVGVVVIIASWNLSLRLVFDRMIPALLAGNSVVIKISSQAVTTALTLTKMIDELKLPLGLINVIVSDDLEVKSALVSHPGVRAVSFVGRLENCAKVISQVNKSAQQNFKKIQVSSGSKNSAVCLAPPVEDISNEFFLNLMNSFMIGQGQLAWNSARLFVLEKDENLWIERIYDFLQNIKPSQSIDDSSVWLPCLKPSSFDKFLEIKKQAYDDQAKLIETNYKLNETQSSRYLPPVFTKDMSRCSTLQQDQIHAPFFILSTVKYPFDIAKYSNISYFGFAAHLYGAPDKLAKVAQALDVGLVTYNACSVSKCGSFSALKQSGFGLQDFSPLGAFFSNSKIIVD